MVTIKLTRGQEAIVDDCDAHLGEYKWRALSFAASDRNKFYAFRSLPVFLGVRRYAFLHHAVIGRPLNRKVFVDHINGNPLDNRRCNLRFVSNRVNQMNQYRHRENLTKTGFAGVHKNGKRFGADLNVKGVRVCLGTFSSAQAAYKAYLSAVRKLEKETTPND